MVNAAQTPNQPAAKTGSGQKIEPKQKPSSATQPAELPSIRPGKIVFLSGKYKGKELFTGTAIDESSSSQYASWSEQESHSTRVGLTFKNVGSRQFSLRLEFWNAEKDVSGDVENVFHLQEIDEETGHPANIFYQEGDSKFAPLVCSSLNVKKLHPFRGGVGFHYATVDIQLKLVGGRGSANRLAPPMAPTVLKEYADSLSKAQRERQGTAAAAKVALAECLSEADNAALEKIVLDGATGDAGRVKGLSDEAIVQASIAGLIPPKTIAEIGGRLEEAIATKMAASLPGVGKNNPILVQAVKASIKGGTVPLPADIQEEIPALRTEFHQIVEAVKNQRLGDLDPVMSQATTNERVRRIGGCGMRLRQANAAAIQKQQSGGLTPEWQAYFQRELGQENALNPQARDQLVLDKMNDRLSKASEKEIQQEFGLKSLEEAKKIKQNRPYKTKDEFTKAIDSKNTAHGLSAWSAYVDRLVTTGANPAPPTPTP